MKINNILVTVLLSVFAFSAFSQSTISITDNDYDQLSPLNCDTFSDGGALNFLDSGGASGVYGNNENDTIVICPELALGSKVTFAVSNDAAAGFEFDVHGSDSIYVYDGPNTSSPLFGTHNSDTDPNGFTYQATFENNPTGCLTIVFISDAQDTGKGWKANITCGNPPQPFTPHMVGFINDTVGGNDMSPSDTGYVDVCFGDSILLVGSAAYPYSSDVTGTGYSQNQGNTTFEWEFTNGTSATGDSIWFTPPAHQGYIVTLKVQDVFPSVKYLISKVRVSTIPSFSGIFATNDSICIGDTVKISGGVTATDTVGVNPTSAQISIGGSFAGLTYLPDGSGTNYTTGIDITGFGPNDTIANASDITKMCVTLEHSYLGDLEMALTCPDGTMINIFNSYTGNGLFAGGFGGGSTYLGDAYDNNTGNPGVGWEYCWSTSNATFGDLGSGGTINAPLSGGNAKDTSGIYLPEQSFAGFSGCPINGTWTITIRDNISIDDGYIFEWGIFFDPAINPNSETYATEIVSSAWIADTTGYVSFPFGQNDTAITAVGISAGDFYGTFRVNDNFGCVYDTAILVAVNPQPTMIVMSDVSICTGEQTNITMAQSSIDPTFTWSNGVTSTFDSLVVTTSITTDYIVTLTDFCNSSISDTITITTPPLLEGTLANDTMTCLDNSATLSPNIQGGQPNYSYNWSNNAGTASNIVQPNATTTYTITVTDDCNIDLTLSAEVYVYSYNPLSISIMEDGTIVCLGQGIIVTATPEGGAGFGQVYTWTTATAGATDTDSTRTLQINSDTSFVVMIQDTCGYSKTETIAFQLPVYDDIVIDDLASQVICENDTIEYEAIVNGGAGEYVYSWTGSGIITTPTELATLLSPTDENGYTLSVVDQCGEKASKNMIVEFEDCSISAPIIFTPNGDGINEYLKFVNLEKWASNELVIYNRWGKKIYELKNYQNNWAGGGNPEGVYYYVLTVADGTTTEGYFHIAN